MFGVTNYNVPGCLNRSLLVFFFFFFLKKVSYCYLMRPEGRDSHCSWMAAWKVGVFLAAQVGVGFDVGLQLVFGGLELLSVAIDGAMKVARCAISDPRQPEQN